MFRGKKDFEEVALHLHEQIRVRNLMRLFFLLKKVATARLGSKLAVPDELRAMQIRSFIDFRDDLLRRSLFNEVWHITALC